MKGPENTGSRLRKAGLRFAWTACVVQVLRLSAACHGPDPAPSRSAALRDPSPGLPLVILWAWERPEDLRFVPKEGVGVAVLAKTLIVGPGGLTIRPRLQPIRIAPEVTTLAVVRLEAPPAAGMRLAGETRSRIVEEIVSVSRTPGIAGIQIDFDALKSQRAFYRGLLLELRGKLPSGLKLSITALASWCVFDDWISDLPIDEAVPMLFRLGAGEEEIGRYLAQGNDFRAAICKHSVGISTDEPFPKLRARRRVYVFNPHRWDAASLRAVMKKVEVTQ